MTDFGVLSNLADKINHTQKAGIATQRFYVTVSYECGVYDELGNMIAIDEDCNSGNTQGSSQRNGHILAKHLI